MTPNIGALRQWLNEDRITDPSKMVCNEEIEFMLGLIEVPEFNRRRAESIERENRLSTNLKSIVKYYDHLQILHNPSILPRRNL